MSSGNAGMEERMRNLETDLVRLQERFDAHDKWAETRSEELKVSEGDLRELRQEIHTARTMGKAALGAMFVLGSLISWAVSVVMKK